MYVQDVCPAATRRLALFSFLALAMALAGNVSQAQAHTRGQCADSVVASCNAAFPNNYDGRIACVNNGLDACDHHAHGAGGKKSASDNLTSSGGAPGGSGQSFKLSR